jgi:hypothetical protein
LALVQHAELAMQDMVAAQGLVPPGQTQLPDWQRPPSSWVQSAAVQHALLAMQTPLQSLLPVQEHTPPVHVPPGPQSAVLQQAPEMTMQVPLQSRCPGGQPQLPPSQACPPLQSAPVQQLVCAMHVAAQDFCPPGHWQVPDWHVSTEGHSVLLQQPPSAGAQLPPQLRWAGVQPQVPASQTCPPVQSDAVQHACKGMHWLPQRFWVPVQAGPRMIGRATVTDCPLTNVPLCQPLLPTSTEGSLQPASEASAVASNCTVAGKSRPPC